MLQVSLAVPAAGTLQQLQRMAAAPLPEPMVLNNYAAQRTLCFLQEKLQVGV